MRISSSKKPQKEPTYQVVLDALTLFSCYHAFLITVEVLEIICNSFGLPSPRLKNHLRTSSSLTRKSAKLMLKSFDIFSRSVLDFRIKSLMNLLLMNKLSHSSRNLATKEILDLLLRCLQTTCINHGEPLLPSSTNAFLGNHKEATPKKTRKWKKPASPSKKQTLVITEEPAKKPDARRQPSGVQIRDTPSVSMSKKKAPAKPERNKGIDLLFEAALLEEVQMKKAIKRRKHKTHLHQAGGLGDGAGLEEKVLDEPKYKSIDTHKGTGLKPRVPDVFKADSSDNYVPTDDETNDVDDEEYRKINEEMYDNMNVELKDAELADEGKGDEEMTDAEKVNVEHEEVNQEDASAQVQDEAQATAPP
ncbi:hypothetical protein Tco_0469140 [Tanacetum coccineum]